MIGRTAGIVAASALGASALLIPSNFELEQGADLVLPEGSGAKHALIQLPCPECAFPFKQTEGANDVEPAAEEEFSIQGGSYSVVINMTVSENGKTLEINGEPVFPMGIQLETMKERVYVNQVASSVSVEDVEAGKAKTTPLEVTSSGVSYQQAEHISPDGHMKMPIKHTIFALEGQQVSLDEVIIMLLKTPEGELFITEIATEAREPAQPVEDLILPPLAALDGETDCRFFSARLCQLKHMLEEKVKSMRQGHRHGGKRVGCHGAKGKKAGRPHHMESHGRPHHMESHDHVDGPHGGYHFMHSFARGLTAVLIPTMAGVAVGMVVSLFGLCFGRLLGFLWFRHRRGGRRGYEPVRLEEGDAVAEAEAECEKKYSAAVLEQSEPLPVYEEAPSYEDAHH